MLRRTPAFTSVAVLSLALGIGANTAVFSVLDAVMLKSLPAQRPAELRLIVWSGGKNWPAASSYGYSTRDPNTGQRISGSFSYPVHRQFREQVKEFTSILGHSGLEANVIVRGQPSVAVGELVSGNYFATLGAHPLIGRTLENNDDKDGAPLTVVISHRFWERQFGRDLAAIGSSISLNRTSFTVIGVMPENFFGVSPGETVDVFVPMSAQPFLGAGRPRDDPGRWWVQMIGRLAAGANEDQARAKMDLIVAQSVATYESTLKQKPDPAKVIFQPGHRGLTMGIRRNYQSLQVLMGVVGLVLLIACANIANLLLARGSSRSREIAVRAAIGAGRGRLMSLLMIESLLLSVIGTGLGLALAIAGRAVLLRWIRRSDPNALHAPLDLRVLLFTLAVCLLTGLLFGLLPAVRATRVDLGPSLKQSGAGAFGAIRQRLAKGLITAQVALSLLLLVGAGLFIRTLVNLFSVDIGFKPQSMLLMSIDPSRNGYKDEKLTQFYRQAVDKIAAIPEVTGVTMSRHALLSGSMSNVGVNITGQSEQASPYLHVVGENFFSVMRTPVLLGRELTEQDTATSPKVAVINETMARKHFEGSPLGRTFTFGNQPPEYTIVGVAKDVKYTGIRDDTPPTVYVLASQELRRATSMNFEIRTAVAPETITNAVRRAISDIDSTLPVSNFRTQEQQIDDTLGKDRMFATLVTFFAALALALACIGLYGLLAYAVSRRTNEIGIRMALGAGHGNVRWLILRESLFLVVIGVAIGVPASLAATRVIESSLYGVKPTDPLSIAAAVVVMLFVAALAAYLPARRAARIDPMVALRYE